MGKCRFYNGCAYKHIKLNKNLDCEELKVKVDTPEKAVQEKIKSNENNELLKEKLEVLGKVLHAMIKKRF